LLPTVPLGPNSRHLFKIPPTSTPYTHVKLNIYPDGGIARFRVYGTVSPIFPTEPHAEIDLAHVLFGGRAVRVSDQHFGAGANLLLPGRGWYHRTFLNGSAGNQSTGGLSSQVRIWEMDGRRSAAESPDTQTG
jgi:allantoicase